MTDKEIIKELIEALRPFADAADYYTPNFPDNAWPDCSGADDIRLGHLRKARAVLAKVPQ